MIAICPPSIATLVPTGIISLKDIIQIARAAGKKPSQKIHVKKTPISRKEYDLLYYLANKERKDATQREYDAAHQEQIIAYRKRRYLQRKVAEGIL